MRAVDRSSSRFARNVGCHVRGGIRRSNRLRDGQLVKLHLGFVAEDSPHGGNDVRSIPLLQPAQQELVVDVERDLVLGNLDRGVVANPKVKCPRTDPPFKLAQNLVFSRAEAATAVSPGCIMPPPYERTSSVPACTGCGREVPRRFEHASRNPAIPCADSRCSKAGPPARRQHSVAALRAADGEETRSVRCEKQNRAANCWHRVAARNSLTQVSDRIGTLSHVKRKRFEIFTDARGSNRQCHESSEESPSSGLSKIF